MKKILLLLSLCLYFFIGHSFAQMRDDGYSGKIHRKYNSKTVFSSKEIIYQEEDESSFSNDFNFSDAVYGRIYWYPGLNNTYDMYGWSSVKGYYFQKEIYLNDELISTQIEECNRGGCTTMPICLKPEKGDHRPWTNANTLQKHYYLMKAGVNSVRVEVFPYNVRMEEKGEMMSSGTFNIVISKEEIANSSNYYFKNIKTYWNSGEDVWNEWKIVVNDKNGRLNTSEKGNKNNWKYIFGYCNGKIYTQIEDDFSSFELKSGDILVRMNLSDESLHNVWVINSGDVMIELKANQNSEENTFHSWTVSSDKGKMTINTTWSGKDDSWTDWTIEDDLYAGAEVKMAIIFLVVFNSMN